MALEARCGAMELEVDELEKRWVLMNDKIEAVIKRLPKRPGINGDQLRAEVRSIDTKLTTTSMKLVEEKTLLRRKDNIKARLKDLAAYELAQQDVQALKDQRAVLSAEKRDKTAQMAEMRQGLRRLRLADRLGVAPRDLAQESIEVPREATGRVIGKKRAALTQLEEDCRVSIVTENVRIESVGPQRQPGSGPTSPSTALPGGSGSNGSANRGGSSSNSGGGGGGGGGDTLVLHLIGTREGVEEARRRLDVTIRTTEAVVKASPPLAATLRASRRALLLRLEKEHGVKIFIVGPAAAAAVDVDGGGTGAAGDAGKGGGCAEHQSRGRRDGGARAAAAAAWGQVAVDVTVCGLPKEIDAARAELEGLDCLELAVPVTRKSLPSIFGSGGANLQQMESDYGVCLDVQTGVSRVVLMGVRAGVEAAADKIRAISHEFRDTEERWPVEPYQVSFLLRNRGAELKGMAHRVGGGVMMTILEEAKTKGPAPAPAPTLPAASLSEGEGEEVDKAPHSPEEEVEERGGGSQSTTSFVWVRGTAPRVSAAGVLLLERLKVAERLTAKVAVREDIVSTFVGHAGSEIRKLRRLCVGCDLGLSPATDGVAEVLLLADDEDRLAAAVGLVEKWVHHQQIRMVAVGPKIAGMLRTFRAAGVRDRITGANRRQKGSGTSGGGGGGGGANSNDGGRARGDAGEGGDADDLFGGVIMDSLVAEGMVRLRGGDEELDHAERLVREFEADNWTTEAPVAISDEDVLLRKGFLRNMQANQTNVNLHYLRDRGVVVVRGRQEHAESTAALLLSKLHGGGELDEKGIPPRSVSLVAVAPSGMEVLTARGRLHLKRLSADTGTEMHIIPAASVVRIRARGRDAEAVAEAKRALLRFVGGHRAEVFLDLAKVVSDASPPAQRSSSGDGGGSEGKAGAQAMEEVGGGGGRGRGVSRDGGVGASAADAKKAAGTPVRSVSNKIIRRTVKLHGCEAEFVAAPPPPTPSPSPGVSSNAASGGRGGGSGNGNRRGGGGAGAERHHHGPHKSGPGRQDAGGRGAGIGATTTANGAHDDGSLSAVTGVSYTSWAPARGVMIRGPPGQVDKARDALVALVLGREDGKVALGEEGAAALGADSWRKIQDSSERVTITPDRSRCSLRVSGPPAAVEACRRELYTMLADAFRGEFVAVPIPREALHEVATSLCLADAAAAAAAATASSPKTGDGKRTAAAAGQIAEVLGPMGVAAAECGWRGEGNVQLLADWPCSCVRVRGEAAAVSVAVDEINTALSKWSALNVTAEVEEWMEPELFGKQRKAIKKLSQSMGGVVLKVVDGVCSGRAASEEEARDATRKLEERLNELRARRAVVRVPPEVVSRLTGRRGCSFDKLKERTRATVCIEEGLGGKEVIICGDPAAVAAAKLEVEAMALGPSKSGPAAQAPNDRQSQDGSVPDADGDPSPLLSPSPGEGVPQTGTPSPLPPSRQNQNQQHAGNAAGGGGQDVDLADRRECEATTGSVKAAVVVPRQDSEGYRLGVEDQERVAEEQPPVVTPPGGSGDARQVQGPGASGSTGRPLGGRDASSSGGGSNNSSSSSSSSTGSGSFETKARDNPRGGEGPTGVAAEPAGSPPPAVVSGSNHLPAKGSSASSYRGRLGERDRRVSAATESEAEGLLASLLLVDNAAADLGPPSGWSHFSPRRREGAAATTGVDAGLRQPPLPPPPSLSGSGDTDGHRATPAATAAGGRLGGGPATPACNGSPPPSLQPVGGGVAPACGGGYFTSSSGIRVRL